MGMFDYIRCELPLPGNPPEWASNFQTKDMDSWMDQYVIRANGTLLNESQPTEDLSDFMGTITFYDSNVVASGPGYYTENGEDARWLTYRALFVHGKLSELALIEDRSERAAKRKPADLTRLTDAEAAEAKARQSESLLGRTITILWGGDSAEPYDAVVIAENERDLVVQPDGGFEIIPRFQRDNCFFDSREDALQHRADQKAEREAERREYVQEVARG